MDQTYSHPNSTHQMDIHKSTLPEHRLKKRLIIWGIILIVLAAILIGLKIKARLDYLKTPEGQLESLTKNSAPITKTPEERQEDMQQLGKKSKPMSVTADQQQKALDSLNN